MIEWIAGKVTGAVLGNVFEGFKDIYKQYQEGKITEAELQLKSDELILKAQTELGKVAGDVIKTEIQSESWITRTWRPIMAMAATFVLIIWYGFMVPIAVNWFGMPALVVGDDLLKWVYTLITIALTGYVAGRSIEKLKGK